MVSPFSPTECDGSHSDDKKRGHAIFRVSPTIVVLHASMFRFENVTFCWTREEGGGLSSHGSCRLYLLSLMIALFFTDCLFPSLLSRTSIPAHLAAADETRPSLSWGCSLGWLRTGASRWPQITAYLEMTCPLQLSRPSVLTILGKWQRRKKCLSLRTLVIFHPDAGIFPFQFQNKPGNHLISPQAKFFKGVHSSFLLA